MNNKTIRSPSLSPSPSKDEEIEDSVTVRDNSYRIRGTLHLGQDKQVQFENQDDRVYDRPPFPHYQRKTPPSPKSQETTKIEGDQLAAKETIPIKILKGKNRF